MKKAALLIASATVLATLPLAAADKPKTPLTPSEIIASAKPDEWVAIAPSDMLVMQLAPDATGKKRQVVIQLMPAPFSQGWVGNIKKLAAAHWWDGTSINRVQDNYVVQWGDATEKKKLPDGLATVPESEYVVPIDGELILRIGETNDRIAKIQKNHRKLAAAERRASTDEKPVVIAVDRSDLRQPSDAYSDAQGFWSGWPVSVRDRDISGIHCYGTLGVGRGLSPDTGTGAELYTVIGHAPRHLDRNIAVVGRVIEGIENLSSLPRGTGTLGFYEKDEERVPIASMRLASELPKAEQPQFEYLSTDGNSFASYAYARANRSEDFFIMPAGGADICNIPVPIRRKAK